MPRTSIKVRKLCPLNIRTTQERRERLEALAAQNGLSLTAQVERLLEFAMDFEAIKRVIIGEIARKQKSPASAPDKSDL